MVQCKHLIPQRYTEPHTPWQNKVELEIGEEKYHCRRRIMYHGQAPEALWDHGFEHTDLISQNTARRNLAWRTPLEVLTGNTPGISDLLDFGYYYRVLYWDPTSARFPADPRKLGLWLGRNHVQGKTALIVRALYSLKSSGASWRAHIAHTLTDMNFVPSHGDPDVWMCMAFKQMKNASYW
jgi:hypothetical protein